MLSCAVLSKALLLSVPEFEQADIIKAPKSIVVKNLYFLLTQLLLEQYERLEK